MLGVHDHATDPVTEEGGGCRDRRTSISQYYGNLSTYFNSTQTACISGGHLLACTHGLVFPRGSVLSLNSQAQSSGQNTRALRPGFSRCCRLWHCMGTSPTWGWARALGKSVGEGASPPGETREATHPPASQDHNQTPISHVLRTQD